MPASIDRFPRDRTNFGIFGVCFVFSNAGNDWAEQYVANWDPFQTRIREDVRWAVERQKRHYTCYWDALTWLNPQTRPKTFNSREIPELKLLDELISNLGLGRIEERDATALMLLPAFDDTRTRYRWHHPQTFVNEREAFARANPKRISRNEKGMLKLVQPGFFRQFDVHMGDAGGSLNTVSWERLLVIALLMQIRADLEVFYESGHMRLAQCNRRTCRAWFIRQPMGQKQRFCSDVCRATAFRDNKNKLRRKAVKA